MFQSVLIFSTVFYTPSPCLPPSTFPSLPLSLCQWQGRCVCVCWTRVRWLTPVLLVAENHGACGFCARHDALGCVTQSLIQHPHWSACRSAVNTAASTVWLPASFGHSSRLSLFLTSHGLLFASYSSSGIALLPFAAAGGGAAAPATYLYAPFSLHCLPVCPLIHPSGASWTMKMWSVPKTACFCSSLSLLTPLWFTNWSSPYRLIQRSGSPFSLSLPVYKKLVWKKSNSDFSSRVPKECRPTGGRKSGRLFTRGSWLHLWHYFNFSGTNPDRLSLVKISLQLLPGLNLLYWPAVVL